MKYFFYGFVRSMMNHVEKLQRMEEHLLELGVPRTKFSPPFYRALWRLGIEVPPPLFTGFLSLAQFQGTLFALAYGLFMWVFARSARLFMPTLFLAAASLVAGALFGLIMAGIIRYKARKLGLPSWSEYIGQSKRP